MDNFIEYYKCGGKTKTPSKPKKVKSCACGSKIKKSNASKKSTKSAKLKIAAKGMKMKGCGCGSKLYRVGGRIVEMDCNNIIKAQMGAPIDYAYGPRFSGKYNGYTYDEGLKIQKMLASAGYNVGVLDGKVGKKTLDALKKYENDFKSGENYDNIMNPKRININEYNEGEGTTLQKQLKSKGLYNGNLDDIYGPKTDKALKDDINNTINKYTQLPYSGLWSGIGKSEQQQPSVRKGSSEIMEIQKRLKRNGYDPGPIDGIMGPKTKRALELEKQDNTTGYLNSSIPTVSVNPLVKKPTIPVVEDLNERPDLLSDEIYMPGNRSNYRLSPLEY